MSYIVLSLLLLLCFLQACFFKLGPEFMDPIIETAEDVLKLFPQNPEGVRESVDSVIEKVRQQVATLINTHPEERNFTTICYTYDRALSLLDQQMSVLLTLQRVSPEEKIRSSCEEGFTKLLAFRIDELTQNISLYKAFLVYSAENATRESLNPEEKYYLKETLEAFKRSGLNLPETQQKEIKSLKKELGRLEQKFEAAISSDIKELTLPRDALAGLDDDFIKRLTKTPEGLYRVPVDPPTYPKIMENAALSSTRQKMWQAYMSRAYPQNEPVLHEIIALRDQLARILGYDSWASYEISDEMAHTVQTVSHFLHDIEKRSKPKAIEQAERYKRELPSGVSLTEAGEFNPWDWGYVKNYYQKKHYDLDPEVVAEYFPLDSTIKALFDIYERFLALRFKPLSLSVHWHGDVRVIEVQKIDGVLVGYLLLDLFPRDYKFTHFCHITLVPSLRYSDRDAHPGVGLVIANFPCPTPGKPALLRHRDVVTFFHEFGHALHALLGATYMAAFSGTNVKFDFVELPSQMFEQWMWDKEIIKLVSCHYITGKKLPDALANTMIALKNINSGDDITRQVNFAQLCLDYFKQGERKDTRAILRALNTSLRPYIAWVPEDHFETSFSHLTDYGSRYYSYLWSQVFALDLFNYIKKEGLLNPEVGKRYVETILAPGGSKPPEKLLHTFLGRNPEKEAFFKNLDF